MKANIMADKQSKKMTVKNNETDNGFFLRKLNEDEWKPLTEQMFKDDMQELIDYAEKRKKNKVE